MSVGISWMWADYWVRMWSILWGKCEGDAQGLEWDTCEFAWWHQGLCRFYFFPLTKHISCWLSQPGHEYTKANVKFCIAVSETEPIKKLQKFAEENQQTQGKFTIGDEKVRPRKSYFWSMLTSTKLHNVFMRVNVSSSCLDSLLAHTNKRYLGSLYPESDWQKWSSRSHGSAERDEEFHVNPSQVIQITSRSNWNPPCDRKKVKPLPIKKLDKRVKRGDLQDHRWLSPADRVYQKSRRFSNGGERRHIRILFANPLTTINKEPSNSSDGQTCCGWCM